MNKRITKILSVLATVAIVASSLAWAIPVAASVPGDGQFTVQDIPSETDFVLMNGSSILDYAVGSDAKTIYVVNEDKINAGPPPTYKNLILKSTDAGQSWETIQNNLLTAAGANFLPKVISVAPDDVGTIAVGGDVVGAPMVVISKDGGTTWATLPAPAAGVVITDIAVAPARTGTLLGREYVVSVANPAAGSTANGDVLIIGDIAVWASVASGGVITGTRDYTSVIVTPNFLGDRAVVAVGTSAGVPGAATTALEIFNTSTKTRIQSTNVVAAGVNSTTTNYDAGNGPNSIIKSSIAIPTNFDPTTTAGRRTYVALASNAPSTDNDVYRIDNDTSKALGAVTGAPIFSVAYFGTVDSGTVFAGLMKTNGSGASDVKYTTGMTSTSPTWTTTLKGPSSAAANPCPILAVASDFATTNRIFATASGLESAFSISNDAGVSFNAESLVNTAGLGNPSLSFTGDAKTVFLVAEDANNFGTIWQSEVPFSTISWKRIFARPLAAPNNGVGLNLSGTAMFLFEGAQADKPIYVSQDSGLSWNSRSGPTGKIRQTSAARDAQTLYYVDSTGVIYKSTNAAWTWATGVSAGVGVVRSISLPKANQIIVGGTGGVAISTDDGATFTSITGGLTVVGTSRFSVAVDSKYADNNILYAVDTFTAGSNIFRVNASNTANTWESMGAPQGASTILGIGMRSGIMYITTNSAVQGVYRTLYPADLVGNQNWQCVFNGLTNAPAGGVTTTAGIYLYIRQVAGGAIPAANIYAFNDYVATTKPTLTSPEDNYNNAVNPSGGNGYSVDLKWKPMGTGSGQVSGVDIEIVDKTNGFSGTATFANVLISPTNPVVNTTNPPNLVTGAAGPNGYTLQPNKTYLWRVRASHMGNTGAANVGVNLDSPWSDARAINVQAGGQVSQGYVGPQLLGPQGGAQGLDPNSVGFAWAPVSGATEYQIIVATDAALTKTIAGTPAKVTIPAYNATGLSNSTVYYWAVKATKPTESVQTVGTFTTMAKPAATPTTPAGGGSTVQPTIIVNQPPAETPAYIWAVIAIGAILVIAVIILIVRTRRTT